MDEQVIWSLVFTHYELCLLAGLLKIPNLIGLEDPFSGFLTDEVQDLLEQTIHILVEKGYLEIQPDDSLIMDAGITTLVEALALAKCTLLASCIDQYGKSRFRLIHLTVERPVEQEPVTNREIVLTAVRDLETLEQRLTDFLNLSAASAAPGPMLTLTEADITEARRLALEEGEETCLAFLNCIRVPSEAVKALATALGEGSGPGSLTVLHREAREMHYGESLAWLVGCHGAWRIQPLTQQEPVTVRLIPAATTEIQQRITRLVETVYQEVRR